MPDKWGFDHLPYQGAIHHRCIDCPFPGEEKFLTDKEREKHFNEHVKERQKDAERRQKENLALARRVKRQKEREDALITERLAKGDAVE